MMNPVKMVGKAITDNLNKMDMADLGKFAAGVLMIVGGVVVLKFGNVSMDEVNEATDLKIDIKPAEVAEVAEVAVETATEVAEVAVE